MTFDYLRERVFPEIGEKLPLENLPLYIGSCFVFMAVIIMPFNQDIGMYFFMIWVASLASFIVWHFCKKTIIEDRQQFYRRNRK